MSDGTAQPVAHLVFPSVKMTEVISGTKSKAKAMCGTWITKRVPQESPVCRDCFIAFLEQGEPKDISSEAGKATAST